MPAPPQVVVTGVGVVSPVGLGREAFWSALLAGRSGVRALQSFDGRELPARIAAEVVDFDPKQFIAPRKSIKVMSRDCQLGVAAANMARGDARLGTTDYAPERIGVVYGADPIRTSLDESLPAYRQATEDGRFDFAKWGTRGLAAIPPLTFLKNLPNMIPAHIAIAHDARGPNNTLHQGEVSGLLAVAEAASIIERGAADCMLAGAASSRMQPFDWVRGCLYERLSRRNDAPADAMRPFDAERDGFVRGEGAAALVLEERRRARSRGATILARVAGWGAAHEPLRHGRPPTGSALRRAILAALRQASLSADDIGHVNAHGLGTPDDDRLEAAVLGELFPAAPVTAPKSYFGNLYAASGVVEAVVSVLSLVDGQIPPTLNFHRPDPGVRLNIVAGRPLAASRPTALLVNLSTIGQAVAMLLTAD